MRRQKLSIVVSLFLLWSLHGTGGQSLRAAEHVQKDQQAGHPVIRINKFVISDLSSYQVMIFHDQRAEFYGLDARIARKLITIKLSSEQYRRALQVFDDVGFASLRSGPENPVAAFATITLHHDGLRKSISYPPLGGGLGHEYAVLITSLEEILQLHDLICPRWSKREGETVDLCLHEARLMEQLKRESPSTSRDTPVRPCPTCATEAFIQAEALLRAKVEGVNTATAMFARPKWDAKTEIWHVLVVFDLSNPGAQSVYEFSSRGRFIRMLPDFP